MGIAACSKAKLLEELPNRCESSGIRLISFASQRRIRQASFAYRRGGTECVCRTSLASINCN